MSLIENLLDRLKVRHWALDLIEKSRIERTSNFLIAGASEPTTGRNFIEMRSKLIKIDLSDSKRIAIISKSGAGKTSLISSMLFFGKIGGFQLFIPFDMKSEYKLMMENLSNFYLGRNIFENEIASFMPYFLTSVTRPEGKEIFQFDIGDLSESELSILLNINRQADFRKRDLLFNIIEKLPKEKKTIGNLVEILNDRMRLEAIVGRGKDLTIGSLMSQINTAIRYGSIGSRYRINFENMLNTGKIVNICFPSYDSLNESMTQAYVAILEKMLKNSLEKRRRKVITAIDEGRIIIPRSKAEGESSRGEIIKNIKTTRYLGETMIFGVQDLKDVEESVVSQTSYYFISHKIQLKDVERMLDSTSLPPDVKYSIINEKMPIIHALARETPDCRPWLMISEESKSSIVYPFLGK